MSEPPQSCLARMIRLQNADNERELAVLGVGAVDDAGASDHDVVHRLRGLPFRRLLFRLEEIAFGGIG